jgi:hypothetical protein
VATPVVTVAQGLEEAIGRGGDEIHVANGDSGWFAVSPDKWDELVERARQEGRLGPNLIVYKTRTNDPRNHYVIPWLLA